MLEEIGKLKQIAHHCMSGQKLPDDLSLWLGTGLQRFLDHEVRSLNDALDLRTDRGGVPWWMEDAIRTRDAALREIAGMCTSETGKSGKARYVHRLTCRYAASAWRFDCQRQAMPPEYAGTTKELLWTAFRSGAAMPISERQLRNILPD